MVQVIINGVKFFCLYAKGIGFLSQRVGLTLALSFLVVALPAISFAAYTDNADGTVTDTSTGLTWKHCAEGQTWSGTTCSGGQIKTYTWAQANALSNTVTFAGHSDWRVPTISELESIIESYFPTTPAINEQVFPNKSNNIFWSSTTDSANANNGMYVNFVYGVTSPMDKALPIAAAHLVRGGGSTPGAGIVTFDLILERGWNLVGNSLDQTLSVGTIFDDPLEVDTVWKWDSATSKWQFYSPEMTAGELLAYSVSKGFAVMSEIKSGEGYWVNAVIKNTLPTQTGAPYILSADDLVVGWNLVSTAESLTPSEFNLALSDNPPGFAGVPNNLTTLWAWDRLSGKWYFYAPSLEAQGGTALLDYIVSKGFLDFTQNSKTLGKGIGFWVNKTSQPLTVAQPTLSLAMTANNGTTPVTSVSNTDPALVTATVLDSDGKPVANAIVTFTVDELYGAFSGGANTALTNVNGLATVKLTTTNTSGGASTLQANTTVNGTSATASLNYAIGSTVLSLSSISVPATSLSAYGTASVSVGVLVNGALYTTPIAVSFTSACATSGKATLTPSVTTVNGTATASYRDNGCNNGNPGDTITATLLNGVTATANLKVSSPATGSLQFVSVVTNPLSTPPMITLKGTGGTNKSETAKVTFRVVDSAGYPLGNTLVTFSLNTSLGGLSLLSSQALSDPVTGEVVTYVQAGTMSTSVRVTATTGAISTQSDLLYISTGIPAQDSISLSASIFNIEGGNYDGKTTDLTVRLADHFHNPVVDGTVVYFTSEGGAVESACTTKDNACSVKLTSQNFRPQNGRVTILARTTGEEAFVDLNSNGTVDNSLEMYDADYNATDIGEAYLDYDENGVRDPQKEPYIDFNGNGLFDGITLGGNVGATSSGDGLYNGLLCTAGANICSGQKSIDVRASIVIVFSTSTAVIGINGGNPIVLDPCSVAAKSAGAPSIITVIVVDQNGNAMPAGTNVTFASDNGSIVGQGTYTVPNTAGCNSSAPGCPPIPLGTAAFGAISVTMKSDGTYSKDTNSCTNSAAVGTFNVKVVTPNSVVTEASMSVSD